MSSVLINVIIGLVTSVISGGSVWLWQQARRVRIIRRKERFFGIEPGGTCLIVMNNRPDMAGTASHDDVQAMIEVASLASSSGALVRIESGADFREINGDRTEFCIGGPRSNTRTSGHIAANLPGIIMRPADPAGQYPSAIVAGSEEFPRKRGREEYALVAKFTPRASIRPVMLICGQSTVANLGAVKLFIRDYRRLAKVIPSINEFCVIIRVPSIETYGYGASELAADVSAIAFEAVLPPVNSRESAPLDTSGTLEPPRPARGFRLGCQGLCAADCGCRKPVSAGRMLR